MRKRCVAPVQASLCPCVSLQKLEEQDRKALNVKEQLQREHRYLKRRLEQLSVSGSLERVRTDSMGSTISTDSEQGSARSRQFEKYKKRIMQPLGSLPQSHMLYRSMQTVSSFVSHVTMICKSNVDHLHINSSTHRTV